MLDTELINSQIDIRAVAEQAGAQFRHNRSRCPIHGGDNPNAFEIYDGGRRWKCHTRQECNQHGGDGIGLLRILNNWSMKDVGDRYARPIDPAEATRRAVENAKRREQELQESIRKAQEALDELRRARKWIEYHSNMNEQSRELWERRGIPQEWQDFYQLGYTSHCPAYYSSPSLTIPIFDTKSVEPVNIRHRLLSPADPNDKYRPERSGMPATPFYGDRSLPIDAADRVIIVEGEIKAAVTFLTVDTPLWQVIGVPGKESFATIAGDLRKHDGVFIIPDPDGVTQWEREAVNIGGARVVRFGQKIDDAINKYGLDKEWISALLDTGKMVK